MKLMSMLTSPAYLAFLFWSTVNLSFLALSISLFFFPMDVAKLLVVFEPALSSACFSNTTNYNTDEFACVGPEVAVTSVLTQSRSLIRFLGVYMLYATAGFSSMLSDAVTFTNLTYKRFIFTLTMLYYIAGGVVTIYLVYQGGLFTDTAVMDPLLYTLVGLFLGALLLALGGTFVACFSGFTYLVPNLMTKSTPVTAPPKSRSAMAAALEHA